MPLMKFRPERETIDLSFAEVVDIDDTFIALCQHLKLTYPQQQLVRVYRNAGHPRGWKTITQVTLHGLTLGYVDQMPMGTPYESIEGMILKEDIPFILPPFDPLRKTIHEIP